ncbi:ATP-binding protein [Glaciimonas immobilis]|uniref:histidine kinase n=1 Tax=Glaciimonas immobilis TaxID=728004 RepID=A0A840RXU2_9BURK|nr:ATP-binding protein [Glaciimonas immobilis]KAF3996400.1 HAMP domain-containing protein [Glaciimonas immobilis]MBB5201270.1 two-component system sensor histidine kinase BaeS [Glaciimonas immobilis]
MHDFILKMSFRLKIFSALLAMAVVVAIAMGAALRFSFTHDFLGYLNQQALQRMEDLTPSLEQAYHDNGNWNFIKNNPKQWHAVMRQILIDDGTPSDGTPPGSVKRSPPISDLTGAHLRISLLDADRHYVVGYQNASSDAILRPLMGHNKIIGWMALTPFESVITAVDLRFQQTQKAAQLIIGLLSILGAGFVAARISSVLLSPLTRLARATHQLAGGDYTTRVGLTSHDEIGRLAQDFNQLAHTLERNERMRRDFMADVSHELRTPLGILNGQLEAIEDGLLKPDGDALQSLQAEVHKMSKLVDDLYDLSLADVGALTYRKVDVDLQKIMQTCLNNYEDIYAKNVLKLVVDRPDYAMSVYADAGRLEQLFNNIFENTLRYTSSNGRLQVTLARQQESWLLQFDDSAPGVDEAAMPRLFERFFRAEASRNRATGGAGLGLAICERIVEAHHGSISASASPLGGLRLTISLPKIVTRDYS